ncbi:MAG: TetR/AcrR family transcriptional regulator [Candidatus Thiodiazotropha sp.]
MGRRGEHSKSEIECMALEAAEAIIESEGYDALSARKVASAIGYTVGSLYFVFRNLDELVQRINGRTLDQLYANLIEALSDCRLPQQCIYALGSAYLEFAARHPHRWRMIYEQQPRDDNLSVDIYREKMERLYELIEIQLKALAVGPEEEVLVSARALWSGIQGIASMNLGRIPNHEEAQWAHKLSRHLISHYLVGMGTSEFKSVASQPVGQVIDYPK